MKLLEEFSGYIGLVGTCLANKQVDIDEVMPEFVGKAFAHILQVWFLKETNFDTKGRTQVVNIVAAPHLKKTMLPFTVGGSQREVPRVVWRRA